MDVAPVKNDCMVTNVQRLFRAVKTKASADVVPQPYGNRRGANEVVVCVGGTDRVVVDLDGREGDVLKFRVGTDFGDNRVDQLTAPWGFRVYEGARLESQPYTNPVPRHGLPCGRDHLDAQTGDNKYHGFLLGRGGLA